MYNPPQFAENRRDIMLSFMRENSFATVIVGGLDALDAVHVPIEIDAPGELLRCHVARPNPIWKAIAASPRVLVIVLGIDHYISPQWYPSKAEHGSVVPTWNYEAVHVRGTATLFEDPGKLRPHLEALTKAHEGKLAEPWAVEDAPGDYIERQMRGIVGIEIAVGQIEGKWKLGQNRSEVDRQGAVAGLQTLATSASMAMADAIRCPRNKS